MLARVLVIALNTYREAVRARILHGLFAMALSTLGYAVVVGTYTSKNQLRVLSDLGAASISLYAIIVAVVLGATSLYRELELKTLFPILARPVTRTEYLVGKYLGMLLLLVVFVVANTGIVLLVVGLIAGTGVGKTLGLFFGSACVLALIGYRKRRTISYLPIAWAAFLGVCGALLSAGASDDRRVLIGLGILTLCEVAIISGIALLFSAFSSPFLTAMLTFGFFIIGRSADGLARLPVKIFGELGHTAGLFVSKVVPNLMLYVPPRPLLTGEAPDVPLWPYVGRAVLHALAWSLLLLTSASVIFKRRDFI
ncbi:MAG TPA: ABC transporter permease subunit [Polyangiaceae bacterium]|nr:ABC transporter permease subunit [Polyangiaceae bacterium]